MYLKESKMRVIDSISIWAQTITVDVVENPVLNLKRKDSSDLQNSNYENLRSFERRLRKHAYNNSIIKTGPSFFDDSDMNKPYNIVVVYERNNNIPLLSTRYYYDKVLIQKLMGNNFQGNLNLSEFKTGDILLADRLSGNIFNSVYRTQREEVVNKMHSEIERKNRNRLFIIMARKGGREKLRMKYESLGFKVSGMCTHQDVEHWVMIKTL